MNEVKSEAGYQHFCKMKDEDPTWFTKIKCHLVHSLEELQEIYLSNKEKKYMAYDTETTGLNPEVDHIVGFSFAFSSKEGWYVPIRHLIGTNVDPTSALDIFYKMILERTMNFTYNYPFDAQMIEMEGVSDRKAYDFRYDVTKYSLEKSHNYDVQVGVFLSDTNWKKTGLKGAEKRFLGWSADTFEETLGDETNFAYLDPEECYTYPVVDAVGTFAVAEKTIQFYKEARIAGAVTNEIRYPFMKCTQIPIRMDIDYLRRCEIETLEHLKTLEHEIISEVGYPFKLNSNKQLGDALQSLGINTGAYTKGGQMKVDIAALETLNLKEPNPILTKLVDYSKSFKLYNSYIEALIKECQDNDSKIRYRFLSCAAPTLRMVSGGDKKNDYYAKINVMAIPKPHPLNWYVHNYHEGDEIFEGDQIIGPWRFSFVDKSEYITEGTDPHMNMRTAFLPDEGHYVVGMDYCQDPETKISTPNGFVKIKDLNDGDLVNTPDGLRKCINPHYTGKKKVVEIKTVSGKVLRLSEEHRLVVKRGRKTCIVKVSEMRVSDKVVEEYGNN